VLLAVGVVVGDRELRSPYIDVVDVIRASSTSI
jgi:hypothetical protein